MMAYPTPAPVDLTGMDNYAILSGTGITQASPLANAIIGDIGAPDGAMITVSCPELVTGSQIHVTATAAGTCAVIDPTVGNAITTLRQNAFTNANDHTTYYPPDQTLTGSLDGLTLAPGVYFTSGAMSLPASGTVTLDAQGDSNAVWVFQIQGAGTGLTTGAGSKVVLSNGAQPKNIFWVVTGPTSLGANSVLNGNILAGPGTTTIALLSGATVNGRLFTGTNVALSHNLVTLPTDPSVHGGPLVTSVSPISGPLAGGNTVIIHGSGFTGVTLPSQVTVDGLPVTSVSAISDSSITALIPVNATLVPIGPVNVVVTTPVGTGTGIGLYSYVDPPMFQSAQTNAAGNRIIVTFDKPMGVVPAGNAAHFTYTLGANGPYTFTSAALNTTGSSNSIDLTGNTSPIAAGDVITLSYTTGGTVVAADSGILAPFATQTVNNGMASAPGFFSAETNAAGNRIIVTFDQAMIAPAGNAIHFTYKIGTGASNPVGVVTLNATNPNAIDLTTLVPAIAAGDAVTVSYTLGTITSSTGGILPAFTDQVVDNRVPAAPLFSSATTNAAGDRIIISFDKPMASPAGNAINFTYKIGTGGSNLIGAVALNTTDPNSIDLTTLASPIAAGNALTVSYVLGTVTSGDGGILAPFADNAVTNGMPISIPTVTSILPLSGTTAGGSLVTITGTHLNGATAATFGSTVVTVTNVTATTLTAIAPSHAAGIVDVSVTTPGGTSATSAADQYTYVAPVPTFTSISPANGSTAGGNVVTIAGTGLTAATQVTFNGTAATSVTVLNDNSITATAPATAGGSGAIDVKVTTAGGIATGTGSYTYVTLIPGVNLNTAQNFVILAKTGITTTGTTSIVGNIGVSPIAATAMTGFALVADASNQFSTSSLLTGKAYASDYAVPTPATMSTAISDMEAAYASAAGRTTPDATELYAGDLGGKTITPGLYKWSTGVLIPTSTTLTLDAQGNADAVWIFQISGDFTMNSASQVVLANGAKAENVYWQVAGPTSVNLGPGAHAEGTILSSKAIIMESGASLNGRALAQTAVTMIASRINSPIPVVAPVVYQGAANGDTSSGVSSGTAGSQSGISGLLAPVIPSSTTIVNGAGTLTSNPFVVDITGMPGVSVSWTTQFDNNPLPNTQVATVVLPTVDQLTLDSISTALHRGLLDVNSESYGMVVQTNGVSTSGPTTVSMTVSPAWVTQNGGNDAIRIVRIANDGTVEVLHTWVDGVDQSSGYTIFKGTSPSGGLGAFWLISVIPYTQPVSVQATSSAPAAAPVSGQLAPTQAQVTSSSTTGSTGLWSVMGVGGALAALAIIGVALLIYLRRNKGKN